MPRGIPNAKTETKATKPAATKPAPAKKTAVVEEAPVKRKYTRKAKFVPGALQAAPLQLPDPEKLPAEYLVRVSEYLKTLKSQLADSPE